jgi:hypothetical protein
LNSIKHFKRVIGSITLCIGTLARAAELKAQSDT